ncbi:hypothetical protein KFK09_026589 [Dendrobium nobile]|uniref:Uncharacterized protein n=1 Tax=Dendrobium nobile TaxID=94219 RepID=A0A8T3A863_DENNO|nr:hypothetical protein KFK09_026589 [Dendrobium nobile]
MVSRDSKGSQGSMLNNSHFIYNKDNRANRGRQGNNSHLMDCRDSKGSQGSKLSNFYLMDTKESRGSRIFSQTLSVAVLSLCLDPLRHHISTATVLCSLSFSVGAFENTTPGRSGFSDLKSALYLSLGWGKFLNILQAGVFGSHSKCNVLSPDGAFGDFW